MRSATTIAATLVLLALPATGRAADVKHLYRLSDFSGPVPFGYVHLHADRHHDETYVAEGNVVRVFDSAGMEIYWFATEPDLGVVSSVGVDEHGDIWILSYRSGYPANVRPVVTRCDYRGRPIERVELQGLPAAIAGFRPDEMVVRRDGIVLCSRGDALAVRISLDGTFLEAHDLRQLISAAELGESAAQLGGFSVDEDGTMVFSVPVLFRVFDLAPDGTVRAFGRPGATAGKFGIISGVARDRRGNTFVADKQRSVVMVFDRDFDFITEFGYYGDRPDNLVRPGELAIGNDGRLYVTQLRNRGVSVYSVHTTDRAGGAREAKEVLATGNLESANEISRTAASEATTAHVNRSNGGSNSRTVPGSSGLADKNTRRTR